MTPEALITSAYAAFNARDIDAAVKDLSGAVVVDQVVHHVYRFHNGLVASMEIVE